MDTELKTEFRVDDEITLRAWRETDFDIAFETFFAIASTSRTSCGG